MYSRLLARRRVSGSICLAVVLASQAITSAQKPADYSQEAFVFEQLRTVERFEENGTGRREVYMRIRTQSEAGVQEWGQLVFGYNSANERADVSFVRVRKPDGTVIQTPADAIQDLSAPVQRIAPTYTDFRQKHVTVQSLRPGDVLEVNVVTSVHTALAPGQFWTEHEFTDQAVVLDEQYEIDVPASKTVTLKVRPGFEAAAKDASGRRRYHWSRSQLKGSADRAADAKALAERRSSEEPEVAAVRLTTFQNWQQVGKWYAALETPQLTPTPEIRKKAEELVAGKATDLEKIEALYEFVATNFRYVSLSLGVGRYQPRPAATVLQEQYGDCKDKHTLLASLLNAAGLKASAVLINSGPKLDPDFPSPSQFNHVITLTSAAGQDIWVDTTSEVAPFRLLLDVLRNKQGLVIDPVAPRLQLTPANPPMRSIVAQDIDGTLSADGTFSGQLRITLRGDMEFLLRTVFRAAPAARWKEVLEEFVKSRGGAGEISTWKVSDPAALRDPFTIDVDMSLPRFADWTSKNITVALPLTGLSEKLPDGDDKSPVKMGAAPQDFTYRLRMTLPAGVTARAPLPVKVTRDYADYRGDYSVADAVVTAERVMTVHLGEVPGNRRQDVAAFLQVVATDSAQRLSLENATTVTLSPTANLTAAQLHRSGYDALQAGNFTEAVALLKRTVELDPKDKAAWNNLGRAYTGLRQTDAAIDAYQKQIEVNAYDQYAYINLGRAYVVKRDYEKAEAAFLKQVEVNPLDKYTPGNLGSLYLQLKRYESAAQQFEKGITLNPEDSWLRVQAGKAYLNLKQVDQATAAFDRAVALSPTPTTWNNIAYELSLHATMLDRAQQYAESAVASVTAASRNLDLARADAAAFGVVRSLGSYWDTLGWVHFAKGDLAKAMPYVEMAWKLGQHAEVGDHVAQILEKQGQKDEAIRTYGQALAAQQPSDDIRKRLTALVGDERKVKAIVAIVTPTLAEMRTFAVEGKPTAHGTADVLVLFSAPDKVEGVRFLSGAESLRPVAEAIRSVRFGRLFPDEGPAKVLRRGVLACAASGCRLTLVLPDDSDPVK